MGAASVSSWCPKSTSHTPPLQGSGLGQGSGLRRHVRRFTRRYHRRSGFLRVVLEHKPLVDSSKVGGRPPRKGRRGRRMWQQHLGPAASAAIAAIAPAVLVLGCGGRGRAAGEGAGGRPAGVRRHPCQRGGRGRRACGEGGGDAAGGEGRGTSAKHRSAMRRSRRGEGAGAVAMLRGSGV